MEENKKRFFKLDIFFWLFLLAVAGYFFLKSAPQATAPDDESMVTSTSEVSPDLPEGVTVEDLGDGNKLVKNEKDDYTLKVNDDIYLYKNTEGNLKLQDFKEPKGEYGGMIGCEVNISKVDYDSKNSIDNQASNMCNDLKPDCKNYKIDSVIVNNISWSKLQFVGGFIGAGWPRYSHVENNVLYKVYFKCSDQNFIDNILNNFSF